MSDEDVDVREDPKLTPPEKETTFRFAKDEDVIHTYSEEAGIVNRLLHHDDFSEKDRRVVNGAVVAVKGTLPITSLGISSKLRKDTGHAQVISGGVFDD